MPGRVVGEARVRIRPLTDAFRSQTQADVDKATAGVSGTVGLKVDDARLKALRADLSDLARKTYTTTVDLDDKRGLAQKARFEAELEKLGRKTAKPSVSLGGYLQTIARIAAINAQIDALGSKSVTASVKIRESLSKASFLQPSLLGAGLALSPALIPLAGGIAGAVGLVGASFGAAAVSAGLFGVMAKSVLTQANTNLQKLQALQMRLSTAATPAAKKSAQSAIDALKATWAPGYMHLLDQLGAFKGKWTKVSQSIAVPALNTWLPALTDGMKFLVPLVQPVAQEFTAWGQALDRYFKSKAGSAEISSIATSLGQFASLQLADLVSFIRDFATGVHNLGHDLSADGVYFGAFGDHLAKWGAEFAKWSSSKQARDDVSKFLKYAHDNGGTIVSIVKQLGGLIPGIFSGASAIGTLELKTLNDFLSWINRLPPNWAKGLTEAAGALLLLSKTGVLKVGFTVVGAAVGWVKKLLGGASVDIGGSAAAAEIRAAMVSGGSAAAAEIRAAMAGGGAAAAGEGAAGAGAGAGAAGGGILATAISAGVAVGAGVALGAVLRAIGDKLSPKGTQAGAVSKGLQTSSFAGIPGIQIAAGFIGKASVGFAGLAAKVGLARTALFDWNKNAGIGRKTADGLAASVARMRQRNLDLSASFRNKLIPDLQAMHADTPKVRSDVQNLADSILNTGNRSDSTRSARQKLIRDLENTGLNAKTATGLVDGMQRKIDAMHGKSVNVEAHGSGSGNITFAQQILGQNSKGFLAFHAAGALVPGTGNSDTVPAMLTPGEAIVPKHLVSAIAPFLAANRVPGFASGGFTGPGTAISATPGFVAKAEVAFMRTEMAAGIKAEVAGMKAAVRQAAAFGFAGPGGGAPAANARLARKLYPGEDFAAWNYVAMRESGWNQFARNPSSGAYGIAQALPPTKYPFAGQAAGGSNPTAQITWMEGYMRQRYGGAAGAAAHERAFNWYAKGGKVGTGKRIENALRFIHGNPNEPARYTRIEDHLEAARTYMQNQSALVRFGHLRGADLARAKRGLRSDERDYHHLLGEIRPYSKTRHWIRSVQGLLGGQEHDLSKGLAVAQNQGRHAVAARLAGRLHWDTKVDKELGTWLDRLVPVTTSRQKRRDSSFIDDAIGDAIRAAGLPVTSFDRGGWLPRGLSMAYNGTNRPEPVGGATKIVLEIRAPHGATQFERAVAEMMQHFVQIAGGGDVQVALGRSN